jgi:hypothetical protein
MNSPNLTTVPLPPARGRSIGRNRADRALGRCTQGPAAASKLGKIRGPQMGRIHRPLRDLYRQRAIFARHGGKCSALKPHLVWKSGQRRTAPNNSRQTLKARPARFDIGGALSCRASLATLADAGENTRHRFTRITLSYRAGRKPKWRFLDRSRSIRRWKLAFRVEFPAGRLRGTLRV